MENQKLYNIQSHFIKPCGPFGAGKRRASALLPAGRNRDIAAAMSREDANKIVEMLKQKYSNGMYSAVLCKDMESAKKVSLEEMSAKYSLPNDAVCAASPA